jgi:hypothetical protein
MGYIILISVLFYLIILVVRGLVAPKGKDGAGEMESELVSDALTGVYFEKRKAVSITTGGQTLYFISVANRDAWLRRNSR